MSRLNKIGKVATFVTKSPNGAIEVRYHDTIVVTVMAQGAIVLNTGGVKPKTDAHGTVTTLRRMNQASNQFGLGFQVYQEKFNWFVEWNGATIPFDSQILTLIPNTRNSVSSRPVLCSFIAKVSNDVCPKCNEDILAGEAVKWADTHRNKLMHADCEPKPKPVITPEVENELSEVFLRGE